MINRIALTMLMMLGLMQQCYAEEKAVFDLGIESMRSHNYSVGIFLFMMIAIAVFVGILVGYAKMDKVAELKTGEKVLFGMIVLGVIGASIFAAVQLLDGFLF